MTCARSPIILSICIPTYNRVETVHGLVLNALTYVGSDVEVVVLDNGSTDDTMTRLNAIDDPRLSVHSNGTNRGVLFNVVNVLLKARGEYCVLLLDKDKIAPFEIGAFKDYLARERVACGFCEYDSAKGKPADKFHRGYSALSTIAYSCHHPTGYFFNTAMLREQDVGNRFVDFDYVGHFCFEFIFAELTLKGDCSIYHAPIFSPESLENAANEKSFGTNASTEDAFFSPEGRLKIAINFSRQIGALPLSANEKRRLVADRFMHGVRAATIGYRSVMSSRELCSHYHVNRREVSVRELLVIALQFFRGFSSAVLGPGGALAFISRPRFLLDLSLLAGGKIFRRLSKAL